MSLFTGAAVLAGALATAGGTAIAAHEISGGQKDAADVTSKAATDAAAIKAKSDADTLAYEKDQAAQTQANFNTTQKANYDQWAARQGRLSAYGQMFGAPAQDIPAFVPPTTLGSLSTTPNSGPTPAGSTGSNPSATGSDPITAQLEANYKALGVTPTGAGTGPTDIAYYAQKVKETGGLTDANNSYWFGPNGRIASDLAKATGGGGGAASTTPAPATLTSLGAGIQPIAPPITGTLNMPTVGSLGSYFPTGAR